MTYPGAAVELTTTSASSAAAASASQATAVPPNRAASAAARPESRFATRSGPAPREVRLAATSSATRPAPTTSTRAPARPPSRSAATSAATDATDAPPDPMAVSWRTRLPASRATWKSRLDTGPVAPHPNALA